MDIHHKVAAWLRLVTSALLLMVLLPVVVGALLYPQFMDETPLKEPVRIVLWLVAGLCIVGVLLNVGEMVAAIFCLRGSRNARYWLMAFAVLSLLNFPVGTALGVYTLWAMARDIPNPVPLPTPPALPPSA